MNRHEALKLGPGAAGDVVGRTDEPGRARASR